MAMDDLISRQDAIAETWKDTGFTDPLNVMTALRDRLEALPSAQPERKKGQWVNSCCSVCGVSRYNFIKMLHIDDGYCGTWNYCPNCGTDLRSDDHETD